MLFFSLLRLSQKLSGANNKGREKNIIDLDVKGAVSLENILYQIFRKKKMLLPKILRYWKYISLLMFLFSVFNFS